MHATQVPRPFHHRGWVYEEKYDGYRMVATRRGRAVALTSHNGLDHTRVFLP
jgi:bifunctional non-homologous end joining protein LigD